jgi:hypothetical protein
LLLLTTYLLAATWWLKFIPMYAGYGEVRIRLGELAAWYAHGQTAQRLHELALGNGWLCLTLAAASPLLAIACAAPLAAALGPPRGKPPYMQADSDPTS